MIKCCNDGMWCSCSPEHRAKVQEALNKGEPGFGFPREGVPENGCGEVEITPTGEAHKNPEASVELTAVSPVITKMSPSEAILMLALIQEVLKEKGAVTRVLGEFFTFAEIGIQLEILKLLQEVGFQERNTSAQRSIRRAMIKAGEHLYES